MDHTRRALKREIYEETALTQFTIFEKLFEESKCYMVRDDPCYHFNSYYLAETASFEWSDRNLLEYEKKMILGYKWWQLNAIEKTEEAIFPSELSSFFSFNKVKRVSKNFLAKSALFSVCSYIKLLQNR